MLLCFGSRVGWTAVGIEASFVADADGVLVVMTGMGTDQVLMTGLIGLAIAGDVVVVSGETESCLVAGDERRDWERAVLAGR